MKRIKTAKIAKKLGAERGGKVTAYGGYFGAAQLAEDIAALFRVPAGGGRSTDPSWDKKRLVPLASDTLSLLERLAKEISQDIKARVEPMQVAALMLEKMVKLADADDAVTDDTPYSAGIYRPRETNRKKVQKTTRVKLNLSVENNNKFVRGRKRSIEDIERCLSQYNMKKLEGYGDYELVIPYEDDDDLDRTIYDILAECQSWADMRNCFTEADVWEIGSDRSW